jgi:hypothetical protein
MGKKVSVFIEIQLALSNLIKRYECSVFDIFPQRELEVGGMKQDTPNKLSFQFTPFLLLLTL